MIRRFMAGVVLALACSGRVAAQTYEIVHRAPGESATGDFYVRGRLLLMPDGSIYCTQPFGGEFGKGLIFRLAPHGLGGYVLSNVHSFSGADGAQLQGSLRLGSDGFIYGATLAGGAADAGTIFRFDLAGRVTLLYDFANGGGSQPSPVFPAPDGNLYGTTAAGG